MARSFSPATLVVLPRMTAVSTARLMAELLEAAAREKKLPASLAADRNDLTAAHEILQIELGRRTAGEGDAAPGVRSADRVEDNAFGALSDWLLSFKRLPPERHPEVADAELVYEALFRQGLGFLTLRAADEWQEAEIRMRLIEEKALGPVIEKLGGKPFLDELVLAHEAYGEALGITKAKPAAEPPVVGKAQSAALDALRSYVLRVAAYVRESEPATAELAERLLAPLTQWKERPRKRAAAASESAPVSGSNG
ncbi:hypothetical protein [Polyangium spumosum]|uniref:Uncharacterized protein n=1 Tax=Polyangium spumosum TaxID=889282 RepID=A0A6N7PPP0_9BACT|nr:hypothetical protein [Polyangium spumosum]MRG94028.1 hypothetical protein [Polyangium spumosum]